MAIRFLRRTNQHVNSCSHEDMNITIDICVFTCRFFVDCSILFKMVSQTSFVNLNIFPIMYTDFDHINEANESRTFAARDPRALRAFLGQVDPAHSPAQLPDMIGHCGWCNHCEWLGGGVGWRRVNLIGKCSRPSHNKPRDSNQIAGNIEPKTIGRMPAYWRNGWQGAVPGQAWHVARRSWPLPS